MFSNDLNMFITYYLDSNTVSGFLVLTVKTLSNLLNF